MASIVAATSTAGVRLSNRAHAVALSSLHCSYSSGWKRTQRCFSSGRISARHTKESLSAASSSKTSTPGGKRSHRVRSPSRQIRVAPFFRAEEGQLQLWVCQGTADFEDGEEDFGENDEGGDEFEVAEAEEIDDADTEEDDSNLLQAAEEIAAFEEGLMSEESEHESGVEDDKEKAEEYTMTMQAAMGNAALIYRHELGMNYARVLPDLIVGSCLQSPEDVDVLRERESVGTVLCLQQDSDLKYFGLELSPIVERVEERGDIRHVRAEIRDFDPFDLRMQLPMAVAKFHKAIKETGSVYVHCTAGLGRAPAVALAYMWWMRGLQLDEANAILQSVRPCGPKLFAIRAAACDLLTSNPVVEVEVVWRNRGVNTSVEIAGLDIGWHNKENLEFVANENRWILRKKLPIGTYFYKHIVNGSNWSYNPDAPITLPDSDGNVNNYLQVVADVGSEAVELRKRLMEDGAPLTLEDRTFLMAKIEELAATL